MSETMGRYRPGFKATISMTMLASGVSQGFGRFSYALAIPAMVRTSLHSIALAGTLGTVNVGAYLVGTVLVSLAATKYRPEYLMRAGLLGSTVGLLGLTASSTFPLLALSMCMAGLGGAFVWVPSPGIAAATVSPARKGLAMGFAGAGIGIFITLSSQIAHSFAGLNGTLAWKALFGVEGSIALITLLLSFRYLKSPLGMALPVGRAELRALRGVPGWVALTAAYATYGLTNSIFITFAVSTLEKDAHYSASHASFEFAVMGFVSIFGGIVVGRISDTRGRIPIMIVNFIMMFVACMLIVIGREPYTLLGVILYGIPTSGIPNTIVAYLGDNLSSASLASAFGAVTMFFGVSQAFGPQLGGVLAQVSGSFHSTYIVAGLSAVAGALLALKGGRTALRVTSQREVC